MEERYELARERIRDIAENEKESKYCQKIARFFMLVFAVYEREKKGINNFIQRKKGREYSRCTAIFSRKITILILPILRTPESSLAWRGILYVILQAISGEPLMMCLKMTRGSSFENGTFSAGLYDFDDRRRS